jgi:surfeit locus 1 family protein
MRERSAVSPPGFPWAAVVFGILGFAVLAGLGTWQLSRLFWKEALLASIDQRTRASPRPLAEIERQFARSGDVDYWPVEVTGAFVHDKERHFFATYDGQSGFFVYTPVALPDGRRVFVNRGFVPYDRKDPATRPEGQVAGTVTISGLARNPLAVKPSSMLPDNEPDKNIFYWKDLGAMAKSAGLDPSTLLPFFVDAGPARNPGGLPVGSVTIVDLPNSHLEYAITWYGLAIALAGVLGVWLWRRREPRAGPAIEPQTRSRT